MTVATVPSDLLLARRELDLERRQAELRRENEILYFEPHEKQYLFYLNAARHYRYARTGNRFGKSELGACEDVAFALGYRPWLEREFDIRNGKGEIVGRHLGYPGHPLSTLGIPNHPTKGLIVTSDWDKSKEIFTELEGEGPNIGKLFKYIPRNKLGQPSKNHSGKIDTIPVKHKSGGWSIIRLDTVVSYKQNPLGFESGSWDWLHIDEPIPEGAYKAIIRGFVDRDGRAWFTCTPLTEPWIDQKFIPNAEDQTKDLAGTVETGEDFWMMTGAIEDNPHNTPASIKRVLSQYTEEEQETRRKGIPAAYSGLVYKEFSWNDHVRREPPDGWTSWSTPPPSFALRFAIDYHPRKPHHVLFIATSPHEVHYVYAEVWLSCLMSELVVEINSILAGREATVPGLIDPLASTPNRVTDISPLDEVLRLGLPVIPATKDPYNGILKVKELLKQRNRVGVPTFVVNPACRRFVFEISRGFMWDGDTNKPVKKDDDAMENFYRLALQGLFYVEPTEADAYTPILRRDDILTSVVDASDFFQHDAEARPDRSRRYKADSYPRAERALR